MSRVATARFLIGLPVCFVSIAVFVLAIMLAQTSWEQGILDTVTDQWGDNVIIDFRLNSADEKCQKGFKTVSAKFFGQWNSKKQKKVGYESRSSKTTRKINVKALDSQKLTTFDGLTLCYKRADHWDFYDIAEWKLQVKSKDTCPAKQILSSKSSTEQYCIPEAVYNENGKNNPLV